MACLACENTEQRKWCSRARKKDMQRTMIRSTSNTSAWSSSKIDLALKVYRKPFAAGSGGRAKAGEGSSKNTLVTLSPSSILPIEGSISWISVHCINKHVKPSCRPVEKGLSLVVSNNLEMRSCSPRCLSFSQLLDRSPTKISRHYHWA